MDTVVKGLLQYIVVEILRNTKKAPPHLVGEQNCARKYSAAGGIAAGVAAAAAAEEDDEQDNDPTAVVAAAQEIVIAHT